MAIQAVRAGYRPDGRTVERYDGSVGNAVTDTQLSDSVDGTMPGRHRPWLGRLGAYLMTLLVLVTLNFFLPRTMPGSPIDQLQNAQSTSYVVNAGTRSALEHYYGLNGSLWTQYVHYLDNFAHGDLGVSIAYNVPVGSLILGRVPWTALLVLSALALAAGIGLTAGIHSGWRRHRAVDRRLITVFVGIGYAPTYLLAIFALIIFGAKLRWFPFSGAMTPFVTMNPIQRTGDVVHHLVLPATVMALQFVAFQYLAMRGGMVSELGSPYLLLGRAKGLTDRRLKYRYAARNALLPVVTLLALEMGFAVGAGIFVETIFAWPGLGRLMFAAIGARDYPTMQGCFLLLSVLVLTLNALADVAYRRLDPRTAT